MNEQGKELVTNSEEGQDSALPAIVDTNIVAIADQSEARLEALGKIKKVALMSTNRHDWVDENGKPYLQASGAEKVALTVGSSPWGGLSSLQSERGQARMAFSRSISG